MDEAGRGPLAGPVYAAAVILDPARPIDGIRDSKKLSAVQREALAAEIRCSALSWSIASADVGEIDTLNILRASHLAMRRALAGLHVLPQHVQIDGNLCPSLEGLGLTCTMEAVIRGDDSVPEIGAASILAKVARDAVMCELDGHYPQYGFALHKGYPTARHLAALGEHGASPIHRRSFGPVKAVLKQGSGGSQEVREAGMEGRGSGPASAAS